MSSTPKPRLQPLDPAEAGSILPLAEFIWRETYSDIISEAQIRYMLDLMYAPARIHKEIEDGVRWRLLIAEGSVRGYLSWGPCPESTKEAVLHKIYLLAEFHGRMLGHFMLDHVRDEAFNAGFRTLSLTVNRNNLHAIRFYEQCGLRRRHAKVTDIGNGFVMDDWVYACSL